MSRRILKAFLQTAFSTTQANEGVETVAWVIIRHGGVVVNAFDCYIAGMGSIPAAGLHLVARPRKDVGTRQQYPCLLKSLYGTGVQF